MCLPSAKLGLDRQAQTSRNSPNLLNIEDPATALNGKSGSMLFAQLESAAIAQLYAPRTTRLCHHHVTHTRLIAALKLSNGCLHFTGHSYHDFDNPQDSALALTHTDSLTLHEIFQLDLSRFQLVCLSACETGLTSPQSIVDEYVGLVSGFLAAGVKAVVSTLWTVDEISSALLMIYFHQQLKAKITPAIALAQAQHWLKNSTYPDLSTWMQTLINPLDKMDPGCLETFEIEIENMQTAAQENDPDHCPFAHPYYWAGYTCTGPTADLSK